MEKHVQEFHDNYSKLIPQEPLRPDLLIYWRHGLAGSVAVNAYIRAVADPNVFTSPLVEKAVKQETDSDGTTS